VRLVGRVPLARLAGGAMVRLDDPPFHVLVAMVQDTPCAIEDACNHAGASLSEGERDGASRANGAGSVPERAQPHVVCPMHGYVFDLRTGRLVEPRGLCGDQRRFMAVVDGPDVVVWDPGPNVAILGP
jgi:nitrite reductase/ring-hydroxylating ferredoxin subunit